MGGSAAGWVRDVRGFRQDETEGAPWILLPVAGWEHVGHTGQGLYVLRLAPDDFPEPVEPFHFQRSLVPPDRTWVNKLSDNLKGQHGHVPEALPAMRSANQRGKVVRIHPGALTHPFRMTKSELLRPVTASAWRREESCKSGSREHYAIMEQFEREFYHAPP